MLQFRNFLLTINNEERTDNELLEYCKSLNNLKYVVFQREKGHHACTEHIQMYIEFTLGKRFETIKSYFPRAHIEERRGTKAQARDYCMKSDTRIGEPIEYGTFVDNGKRSDLFDIYELVKDGATDYEIMDMFPSQYMRYFKAIQNCRQTYVFEKFRKTFRKLDVTYIWGPAGSGKSRYVLDKYGFENVYRVTNYEKGAFDSYKGQDVIVFEEFRSSFSMVEMLNYLDGYPLQLPCRYSDLTACYTKVFIITNIPLYEQYKSIQKEHGETWRAFLRRINKVLDFDNRENKEEIIPHSPDLIVVQSQQENLPF